jgi:hypothetical protein
MTIRTFSGTHDWDPTVLIDTDADDVGNADDIIWDIEHGQCPRCEGPLPTMPEYPAGSRVTECRSIPICGRCGNDEAYEEIDAAKGIGYGGNASGWPLPVEEIDERRARYEQQMKPAILSVTDDGLHLVTEDGSAPVINPRNTGGWAQYGADKAPPGLLPKPDDDEND